MIINKVTRSKLIITKSMISMILIFLPESLILILSKKSVMLIWIMIIQIRLHLENLIYELSQRL